MGQPMSVNQPRGRLNRHRAGHIARPSLANHAMLSASAIASAEAMRPAIWMRNAPPSSASSADWRSMALIVQGPMAIAVAAHADSIGESFHQTDAAAYVSAPGIAADHKPMLMGAMALWRGPDGGIENAPAI